MLTMVINANYRRPCRQCPLSTQLVIVSLLIIVVHIL